MTRNPRSAYVRRKQAGKACPHCGGTDWQRRHPYGAWLMRCRGCDAIRVARHPKPLTFDDWFEHEWMEETHA